MPSTTTVGRYELRAKLGAGAFGTVYRAYDPNLDRDIALKILKSDLLATPGVRERFQREARAAARLDHPNIVPIHDADTSGKHCYLASKLIAGKSLDRLIPENGFEPRRAVTLLVQLLDALAHAHAQGILHRDVKPANCLVHAQDRLYLTDFGLAGSLAGEMTRLTKEGAVMGTVAYMAPEQAQGQWDHVGAAADQYSAGVTLYELLTGRRPFDGPPVVVLHHAINTAPPPLTGVRPGLDGSLETLCLTALAKSSTDRFGDCGLFAEALRAWLTRLPPLAGSATVPVALPASSAAQSARKAVDVAPPTIAPNKPARRPNPQPTVPALDPKVLAQLPATLDLDLGGGVKMELVLLNAKGNAEFEMGASSEDDNPFEDEKPQHKVRLTKPFYLGKYPVTQEQYDNLIGKNPSYFWKGGDGEGSIGDVKDPDTRQFPVEEVCWDEATFFCKQLADQHGSQAPTVLRQQNCRFALPTEAQWEYACRAGTTTPYYFSSDSKDLGEYAWFTKNSSSRTHLVGTRKPNGWGLYDMHGNVWQWCQDDYDEKYYGDSPIKDPLNIKNSERRVLRGGSWGLNAWYCRAAARNWNAPDCRLNFIGFRVAFRLD